MYRRAVLFLLAAPGYATDLDGTMGQGLLRVHRRLTIDYSRRTLTVEPLATP